MPRNAEVTRQWKILLEIQGPPGRTIDELAKTADVCTRTIRRDLEALQDAGFALVDVACEDGKTRWRLDSHPLKFLREISFTITEIAALYFSRRLLECAVATHFQAHLKTAFEKLEKGLPDRMRTLFDSLPQVLTAKAVGGRGTDKGAPVAALVERLMQATVDHHRIEITYHSFASRRVKDYTVEPYRLAYSDGGFYLSAFVPDYGQMRTFAVGRIKALRVLEESFSPVRSTADGDPFPNSLGVHSGRPERVEIEFAPQVAPYIEERTWHSSQAVTRRPDGSVLLSLDVCLDWALSSWVLGFGPFARVVSPAKLAEQILEELDEARDVYAPKLALTPAVPAAGGGSQRVLPFSPGGKTPRARKERQRLA